MLHFEPINSDNILKTAEYFKYKISRTADYTIGAMYMWRNHFDTQYAIFEDMIMYKVKFMGRTSFTLPAGSGSIDRAMEALKAYCRENNIPLWFCTVPEEAVSILVDKYKGIVPGEPNRDFADYLYLAEDLAEMAGRRYSGQRNHINRFKKLYPDYKYEKITQANINRVIEFLTEYQKDFKKTSKLAKEELFRAIELMDYFNKFNLVGGFIEVEGKIVAMSVGEIINDTLYCHIEKADRNYHGSYQMIVKEFAKNNVTDEVKYINREDDAGDEGLRTSKLSYHPYKLLNKYCVLVPVD
ncbi:hypothetical protein DFR55_10780 [Herbinix hemicellulosilytica]|uniref:Phosphatidylglycerol lysyltransferase C-terminal domain-containing protein n=1 Tax=Herbinix hemicellulosilytica TaxID=1564487 RepID=A0A0H5SKM4_HERHM|nr:phosphatidylglycerol lysyltransferase domain-containing protein [Herbinix hemicellulosilytica]RBP59211.1 hypothetical protein DFR55_10780 [Herbinix hemicellulosilytica]CRZ35346.1 hypothetical protein HHT355_2148 [Herbinix hemicellulosilytica]